MSRLERDDVQLSEEVPIERSADKRNGGDGESPRAAAGDGSSATATHHQKQQPYKQDNHDDYYRAARQAVYPYLPPPMVRAIETRVDPFLLRTWGIDEGTAKLAASALLAYVALWVVRWLASSSTRRRGRAVMDDSKDTLSGTLLGLHEKDDDEDEPSSTVLICGPSLAGKTRLFYHLLYNEHYDTVSSLQANVAVMDGVRYVDWPGTHKIGGAAATRLRPVLQARNLRIALVTDSTQTVTGAADCLHQLFSYYHRSSKSSSLGVAMVDPAAVPILVLCHKSDLPTAKNAKRIQLQLRGELERLLKSSSAKSASAGAASNNNNGNHNFSPPKSAEQPSLVAWWPVGEPLEFERLNFVRMAFASTTCEGGGCRDVVNAFCRTGELPGEAREALVPAAPPEAAATVSAATAKTNSSS
jgi:hypothetical protein